VQPMVNSALKTSETLKIFLVITHNLPMMNVSLILDNVISKESTENKRKKILYCYHQHIWITIGTNCANSGRSGIGAF
jgi:hypothetical protein